MNEISEDDMNTNGNHKQSENLNPPSNHPRFLSHNRTESLSRKNLKEHNKMLQPYKFQLYSDLKSRKSTAKSFTMSESGTYKFDLISTMNHFLAMSKFGDSYGSFFHQCYFIIKILLFVLNLFGNNLLISDFLIKVD